MGFSVTHKYKHRYISSSLKMTYRKDIHGVGMHSVHILVIRSTLLYLGTNIDKLLSNSIIVAPIRNFERAGVSMSRKVGVGLIGFHLARLSQL